MVGLVAGSLESADILDFALDDPGNLGNLGSGDLGNLGFGSLGFDSLGFDSLGFDSLGFDSLGFGSLEEGSGDSFEEVENSEEIEGRVHTVHGLGFEVEGSGEVVVGKLANTLGHRSYADFEEEGGAASAAWMVAEEEEENYSACL